MKIIILHIGDVLKYPPVITLINLLKEQEYDIVLITTKSKYVADNNCTHIKIEVIPEEFERPKSRFKKLLHLPKLRNEIWKAIDKYYSEKDLIWITSNTDLKYLGERITQKNYVLQLMELCEKLTYYHKIPFLTLNREKIGNSALAVVIPEYNRAHITKAWWTLKNMPLILPNKPYCREKISRNLTISDPVAQEVIENIKGKKIILYQGILGKERPLDRFIKAVDKLGDDYAFVLMTGGKNIYADIDSSNYYFIPFVNPPRHLQITSCAYIGIMSYVPTQSEFSVLNALYCAPNKIFEYSMFGIPMIGNDVPGLRYAFDTHNCGICIENMTVDEICEAIRKIEKDYDTYSMNARRYYDSVDMESRLMRILDTAQKRMKERQ